jgi:predicted acyl esterase
MADSHASETTNEVWIDFDRRVPMRDGVELSADVYRPKGDGRYPTILMRNLNTGESLATSTRMIVAEQHIYHDAAHPSCVILPIVPRNCTL